MMTAIPDLWPEDITVTVLPPLAILKAQEGLLARKTQGMLQAKLSTTETDQLVQHQLDLIAPSLSFYRIRVLSATHARDRYYPALVTADCFGPKASPLLEALGAPSLRPEGPSFQREAATDEELVGLVREVLHSVSVRSLIQSLIARINELSLGQQSASPDKTSLGNGPVEHV